MQIKTLMTGLTATVALCLTGVASGQFTSTGTSSDWFAANAWDCGGTCPTTYPDSANHTVVIQSTHSVTLDFDLHPSGNGNTVTVGSLTVGPQATLIVQDSNDAAEILSLTNTGSSTGRLIVQATASNQGVVNLGENGRIKFGPSDSNTHFVGGQLVLQQGTSEMLVDANATIEPYDDSGTDRFGSVVGQDSNAEIQIEYGPSMGEIVLTNHITFAGEMEITPVGTVAGLAVFKNARITNDTEPDSGVVRANSEGTLLLADDLTIRDALFMEDDVDYLPLWEASTNSGAVLQFDEDTQSLVGDFAVLDCAMLFLEDTVVVSTDGVLLNWVGTISPDDSSVNYFFESANVKVTDPTTVGCPGSFGM